MDAEARVVRIAERQLGLITTQQLFECGFSRWHIQTRSARRQLISVRRGVWALAGSPATPERAILAAILAGGSHTVASHQSAALVWDLPLAECLRGAADQPIVLTSPRQCQLEGATVHRRDLPSWQRTSWRGVPVTTPARTIVDLAGAVDQATLAAMTDELLRRGLLPLERLQRVVATLAPVGRQPLDPLRELLGDRVPGYDPGGSRWEREMDDLYDTLDLPPAVRQHEIPVGSRVYRVDRAIVDLRIAMEWKGYRWHAGRDMFDYDADREADLASIGWQLLTFTSHTTPRRLRSAVIGAVSSRSATNTPDELLSERVQ